MTPWLTIHYSVCGFQLINGDEAPSVDKIMIFGEPIHRDLVLCSTIKCNMSCGKYIKHLMFINVLQDTSFKI